MENAIYQINRHLGLNQVNDRRREIRNPLAHRQPTRLASSTSTGLKSHSNFAATSTDSIDSCSRAPAMTSCKPEVWEIGSKSYKSIDLEKEIAKLEAFYNRKPVIKLVTSRTIRKFEVKDYASMPKEVIDNLEPEERMVNAFKYYEPIYYY